MYSNIVFKLKNIFLVSKDICTLNQNSYIISFLPDEQELTELSTFTPPSTALALSSDLSTFTPPSTALALSSDSGEFSKKKQC